MRAATVTPKPALPAKSKRNALHPDLSCFYELPDDSPAVMLVETELIFRQKYGGCFTHRTGLKYFFRFQSQRDRDAFLHILQVSCTKANLPYELTRMFI